MKEDRPIKVNGIYSEQTGEQKQVIKEHISMPKYSNLKMKPQIQANIVMFKGKEAILTQEQKALNNLNSLLKQNVINRELNDVLIKEVNAKNKNVIKYLNAIKASKDPSLKGHKAIAQRLVDNHAQISGAIASLKTVDDETKQKLDFVNQKTMVHGINEIYGENKVAINNIVESSNVSFGIGTKAKAELVVAGFSATAAGIAAGMAQVPMADQMPLIANDIAMTLAIGKVYDKDIDESVAQSLVMSALGNQLGTGIFKSIVGLIPGLGNGINATVLAATTETVGHIAIKYFQKETGDYS